VSQLRRRRQRRVRRSRQRRFNLALIVGGTLAALVAAVLLVSAFTVHSVGESLRDGELKEIRLGQNTRIYDKDGKQLGIMAAGSRGSSGTRPSRSRTSASGTTTGSTTTGSSAPRSPTSEAARPARAAARSRCS
jgi:hypothetical protein